MRFDDSLDTVLAAEVRSGADIQAAWRQLVDLIGRRRVPPVETALTRLRAIRRDVPLAVRAASARGLERADPPAALVALFSDDEPSVAGPVVRAARLTGPEWTALLPAMRPATRGVLRHRRDLPAEVARALAIFGQHDFGLPSGDAAMVPGDALPAENPAAPVIAPLPDPIPAALATAFVPPEGTSFLAVAEIARELPVVAEARRLGAAKTPAGEDFEIAAIVARLKAHQRTLDERPAIAPAPVAAPDRFRFETDARGLIRWCEGVERGALIGLSLTAGRDGAVVSVDGVAGGAFARRARFVDARLAVGGQSDAAGSWRISAVPAFDHASGRFTGYRGTARRPRADEQPPIAGATATADALRQLVHELRTPANAISGFAEMIEHQLLGPVAPLYRERAAAIRGQTVGLLEAIDDLDTAARLESRSLTLLPENVALAPLLGEIIAELDPLADLRGARLTVEVAPETNAVGDARAIRRLLSRLLMAVVAKLGRGETTTGSAAREGDLIRLTLDRPAAFAAIDGALFSADAEVEAAQAGGPLLGAGFAFRLARNLTVELGGSLTIGTDRLTLSLPAAVDRGVEQATV